MKVLIQVVIGLLVVGRGKSLTEEETKVVGSYEMKQNEYGDTSRVVLLENGIARLGEFHDGSRQAGAEYKWTIVNGEIHVGEGANETVYKINQDKSITWIAYTDDEKRKDYPKEEQDHTYIKKITPSPFIHPIISGKSLITMRPKSPGRSHISRHRLHSCLDD